MNEKNKMTSTESVYNSFRQLSDVDFFLLSTSVGSDARIITLGKSYVVAEITEKCYLETFPAKLINVERKDEWVMLEFQTTLGKRCFFINLVEDYFNLDKKWQILDIEYFLNEIEDMELKLGYS